MSESVLTRSLTAALCGLLVLPAAAFAADGERTPLNLGGQSGTSAKATQHVAGSSGGAIARTIVGLAVVIAVIYGVTWVLKQVKGAREGKTGQSGLEPISTLTLGDGKTLHLVRAGQEIVLLGSGEHGLVPVRSWTEEEARRLGVLPPDDGDDPQVPGGLLTAPARRRSWLDELRARTVIK